MAVRKPLVLKGGRVTELAPEDSLAGSDGVRCAAVFSVNSQSWAGAPKATFNSPVRLTKVANMGYSGPSAPLSVSLVSGYGVAVTNQAATQRVVRWCFNSSFLTGSPAPVVEGGTYFRRGTAATDRVLAFSDGLNHTNDRLTAGLVVQRILNPGASYTIHARVEFTLAGIAASLAVNGEDSLFTVEDVTHASA